MDDWPIIFSYTRAQAIADGVLVDVTTQAAQIGFKVHTVVTDHLYNEYVAPPAGLEGEGQSVEGRLQDLLFRTLLAAKAIRDSDRAEFDVLFLMAPGRWDTAHVVAAIGPGDQGEPVMTIMLPEDD
ncbi:DUF6573 family protein [Desulfovibrio sp. TomC]|uniref:DUF6573 family protein n=1 Tax=Desulfovibrio sp. TomC TaxID=1562888 RepID=UPI0005740734|nr:DUF6573 family protein [Desulfovibrio sp. TomC]KHK01335.1 DNA or RNA helicases of superfamily II [Desulfovibrio sp. TomC]